MFGITWRIATFVLTGGLAVLGGGWLFDGISQRAEIRSLNRVIALQMKTLEDSGVSVGVCHANVANLGTKVDEQGKDIRDLAKATKDADDRAEKARLVNAANTKAARDFAKQVLDRPLPTPDNACVEAAKLLRGPM